MPATTSEISNGIKPEIVRKKFGIYHPVQTSVTIEENKAKELIEEINKVFIKKA